MMMDDDNIEAVFLFNDTRKYCLMYRISDPITVFVCVSKSMDKHACMKHVHIILYHFVMLFCNIL
jgi:hypothetical protein